MEEIGLILRLSKQMEWRVGFQISSTCAEAMRRERCPLGLHEPVGRELE